MTKDSRRFIEHSLDAQPYFSINEAAVPDNSSYHWAYDLSKEKEKLRSPVITNSRTQPQQRRDGACQGDVK
jgi:hypothetical protein